LGELLERSDLVSIHTPLTPETRGLIGERELRLMKRSAILVNTARGPIVDQDALRRALEEGWIAGAGLDVTDPEPLPGDDPLLGSRRGRHRRISRRCRAGIGPWAGVRPPAGHERAVLRLPREARADDLGPRPRR